MASWGGGGAGCVGRKTGGGWGGHGRRRGEGGGGWRGAECGGNCAGGRKKQEGSKPRGADVPAVSVGRACRDGAITAPVEAPVEAPAAPVVTFDMCRNFLYGEIKARRDARRERISVSMF